MHLSHPVPHHNTPKSGLLIFHPQPKHPESPGFTSTPGEERMEMGQGKAAGLEVQGETQEKVCGQWWCLGEVSLAMAVMSHSPASGASGATLTLHGLKEEVDPAIHHPHLFCEHRHWAAQVWPWMPPQPGGEVRQKEGLGLLPLLLGLALEEQGWGTPASGGEVLGYPCKPPCSSYLKGCTVSTPQGAAILGTAICHTAELSSWQCSLERLCRALDGSRRHSDCATAAIHGQLWPVRRGCGQTGPCTLQPLSLEHMSWLTPTELLWPAAEETLLLQGCWSPHSGTQGKR